MHSYLDDLAMSLAVVRGAEDVWPTSRSAAVNRHLRPEAGGPTMT